MEAAVIPATIATTLVAIVIVERIINAFLATIWHITIGFEEDEAKYSFAAMQLMSSSASVTSRILLTIISSIATALSSMFTWLLIFGVIVILTGTIYLGYEQFPVLARGFVQQYNEYMGPQIHSVLIIPIDIATLFLKAFLPLYNAIAFIIGKLLHVGVLKPFLRSPQKMLQAVSVSTQIARSSTISINSFTINTFQDCNTTKCISDIGSRTLDLIVPLMHVRSLVAVVTSWIAGDICTPLSPVLDIVTYPFTDINFAKGIHNLVNGVLWLTVQIPVVTEARCRLFEDSDGMAMCIPDFEPVSRFFIEALHNMGQMVDNWLDIFLVIVQGYVSPSSIPQCQASPLSSLSVEQDYHQLVFGSNFSVVVGLTETMFAMTDGVSVIYYSTAKLEMSSEVVQNAWPIEIDVKMGVAAVQYESTDMRDDTGRGETTSMLGCR